MAAIATLSSALHKSGRHLAVDAPVHFPGNCVKNIVDPRHVVNKETKAQASEGTDVITVKGRTRILWPACSGWVESDGYVVEL